MIATNYSDARQNLKKYFDTVVDDFETIIITRTKGKNVVIISEDEYNNMIENLYLRTNEEYYNDLIKSIDQIKNGKLQKRELIDE